MKRWRLRYLNRFSEDDIFVEVLAHTREDAILKVKDLSSGSPNLVLMWRLVEAKEINP